MPEEMRIPPWDPRKNTNYSVEQHTTNRYTDQFGNLWIGQYIPSQNYTVWSKAVTHSVIASTGGSGGGPLRNDPSTASKPKETETNMFNLSVINTIDGRAVTADDGYGNIVYQSAASKPNEGESREEHGARITTEARAFLAERLRSLFTAA